MGHRVVCVDNDEARVNTLREGGVPIFEDHLPELLAKHRDRGLEFTTDLGTAVEASEAVFIAVGTPQGDTGAADLSYVEAVVSEIARSIGGYKVIVEKSTVPVYTNEWIRRVLHRHGVHPQSFDVVSNPEFLREGCAIADSLYPDRIVTGAADKETLAVMQELYRPLVEQNFEPPPGVPRPSGMTRVKMVTTTLTSAEMIKYAANAFLAMKIGFANEIANICEHVGAEAPEVMTGIGLDSRIGAKFLSPGIGWGGSCFGKDVLALLHTAHEYGYESRLLRASIEVNTAQRQMVIQKLQEKLFILKGRTIGLLGLAFKPDTDDLRDAPSLHIAERLLQMGARVKAYDPVAMAACREQRPDLRIRYCESAQHLAVEADALVLVTEWREFRDLDLAVLARAMARPVLVDGRNLFSPEAARAAGFDYTGIGRPRPRAAGNAADLPA